MDAVSVLGSGSACASSLVAYSQARRYGGTGASTLSYASPSLRSVNHQQRHLAAFVSNLNLFSAAPPARRCEVKRRIFLPHLVASLVRLLLPHKLLIETLEELMIVILNNTEFLGNRI